VPGQSCNQHHFPVGQYTFYHTIDVNASRGIVIKVRSPLWGMSEQKESMVKKKKLSPRQYASAIMQVAKLTYKAAPLAVIVQLCGALVTAILPIVTTYFAALATTALAEAYTGVPEAGNKAITYVLLTALLGILMTVWHSVEQYVSQLMRYRVEAAMSDRMYEHFLSLDFWRYDDKDTVDLYDRATDFARFFPYVFDRISGVITQFITMVAGLVALVFVSWWLGLIILLAIIPGVYLQFKLSRAQIAHRNAHVTTRRSKNLIEWLLGNKTVTAELRLYGVVKTLLQLRTKLRDKDEKERIEFERQYIFKRLGADMLEAAAEAGALVFIVLQIIARQSPIGQFIYVQQVVSRALGGANGFVSQISSLDEDLANLFDYQAFMEFPVRVGGTKKLHALPDNIRFNDVSFRYPNMKSNVLQHVTFEIKKGQHIAIVGENGAGKTTLIKLLTGLYKPTEGAVFLGEDNLDDIAVESWHRQFGVLQQSAVDYSFANARDNINFGDITKPLDDKRLAEAMDRAEARGFLEKLPQGLDSYINTWMEDEKGNKGIDLSGGQWQRLALARNFYRDSPLIILDEPTSAIDALAESRIFKHLFADKNRTVVTISHRLTTVEKADVIYMLQDGKIVERGTHSELVNKRGAYYTMFESQLHTK
jgi:ATP-binding cassette, subfamily B, bacterial